MILADSSAWIEFLRRTGSRANVRVRELLAEPDEIGVTDAVLMEVLAGARDRDEHERLRRLLARCRFLPTLAPRDYEVAAELYRLCRGRGETVRRLLDCLIAAVALRAGVPVLHADADFDAIARHAPLGIA